MAIDTASKRASALGFGLVALSLVIPSGVIDQQAKQTISNIYSGILATQAIAVIGSLDAIVSVSNAYQVKMSVSNSYSLDASVLNALNSEISVK